MKITKRQLKRIIREEYSRLQKKGLIREMGASYGSAMVKNFPEMGFYDMLDAATEILEDLEGGGHVLIPVEDSGRLMSFVENAAEDEEGDMDLYLPLINRDNKGANDSWSLR